MALMLATPYSYFADVNGAPMAGGWVYTYFAGTTSPQNAYTDSSLGVPLPNPAPLDSAGRAQIWLNGTYKIVVKDSLLNVISTTDNIVATGGGGDMQSSTYDPANIGEQLVGINAAQTLANKKLITPDITGATNGGNANAGSLGEAIESTVLIGAAVSLVANTAKDITSISLTAGDWDVEGSIALAPAGSTTFNGVIGWINVISAIPPPSPNGGAYYQQQLTFLAGGAQTMPVGKKRISIATTTTIYLSTSVSFGTSTMAAYGYLGARRVR